MYVYNCVFGTLISDVTCIYVSADGRRDGHFGLPFSDTGCPIPDVDNLSLLCIDLCLGCCFYFYQNITEICNFVRLLSKNEYK